MAAFTFSKPTQVFTSPLFSTNIFTRAFQAIVDARMARAEREVRQHIASLDSKTRAEFDLDAAIVGKGGRYVWPY